VIGFLNGGFAERYTTERAAFLSGLNETGFVDSRNVTIEYRWAEGQTDRLPILANDSGAAASRGDCSDLHTGGARGQSGD
jgi:putative ABC transport system substrate-binding protein